MISPVAVSRSSSHMLIGLQSMLLTKLVKEQISETATSEKVALLEGY